MISNEVSRPGFIGAIDLIRLLASGAFVAVTVASLVGLAGSMVYEVFFAFLGAFVTFFFRNR